MCVFLNANDIALLADNWNDLQWMFDRWHGIWEEMVEEAFVNDMKWYEAENSGLFFRSMWKRSYLVFIQYTITYSGVFNICGPSLFMFHLSIFCLRLLPYDH